MGVGGVISDMTAVRVKVSTVQLESTFVSLVLLLLLLLLQLLLLLLLPPLLLPSPWVAASSHIGYI